MRRNLLALILGAGVLIGAGLAGGYWLAANRAHKDSTSTSPVHAESSASTPAVPATGNKTNRKVLYWHDPMVPGRRFDKPGKSPYMDMELVPVYADEAVDEGNLRISPRTVQNLGIRVVEVTEGQLDMGFSAGCRNDRRARHHDGPVPRQRLYREALCPGSVRRRNQRAATRRGLRAGLVGRGGGIPRLEAQWPTRH